MNQPCGVFSIFSSEIDITNDTSVTVIGNTRGASGRTTFIRIHGDSCHSSLEVFVRVNFLRLRFPMRAAAPSPTARRRRLGRGCPAFARGCLWRACNVGGDPCAQLRLRIARVSAILCAMKTNGTTAPRKRVELGKYIVADSGICHGKPTFKGSRVMVWQVLDMVRRGLAWDEISRQWRGKVPGEAIAEALELAGGVFCEPRSVAAIARGRKRLAAA